MALVTVLFLYCTFLSRSALAASSKAGRTHYAPPNIGSHWQHVGASSASDEMNITFVLKSKDYDGLTAKMEQIALEGGEWLSVEELSGYVGAADISKATLEDSVKSSLSANEFSYSVTGDKLTVKTTVDAASKFFQAEFNQYNVQGKGTAHRTLAYTIPHHLTDHVDDVYPIATFAGLPMVNYHQGDVAEVDVAAADTDTSCGTPTCYRELYEYDSYLPTQSYTNIGVLGYFGNSFLQSDVDALNKKFAPWSKAHSVQVEDVYGGKNDPSTLDSEAALDVQIVTSNVSPIGTTFWDFGKNGGLADIWLETYQYLIELKHGRSSVISTSYVTREYYFSREQAQTMCKAAQQLTALGVTIVNGSGDWGTAGDGSKEAKCNPKFVAVYPSICPYVLSVGATTNKPQTLVGYFSSGAGFSTYFSTPSYQSKQVAAYEKKYGGTQYYNKGGRAFPDVVAQGANLPIAMRGKFSTLGGTSAAGPVMASGIALLNNLLRQNGKPVVGYLHPKIYANPSAFTDITSGGSYCNGSSSPGLEAKPGWDPASGLGTPLFKKLRAIYGV